ncbi:MAG TPA: TRAM domain-containing protein [Nocardioidaceae bacterium]|nr:TRAM domain-containing protein [Nocardioidaceae bacterium]
MTRRPRSRTPRGRSLVGQREVVEVGAVAHGGHFVARHEGRVIFVRHALPGERVVVEITEGDDQSKFLRGDAVDVLEGSPNRVEPPCPFSGPRMCGGCDFQHVAIEAQRELKAFVVREQLQRLAGLDLPVVVEAVRGDEKGLRWRTRVQYAIDDNGHAGLRKHRSHEVVRVDVCPIAHPQLPPVTSEDWSGADTVEAIWSNQGEQLRLVTAEGERFLDGPKVLHEDADGRVWRVTGSGFWQVHPGAADALVSAVLEGVAARSGERALDLYSGVGLFTAGLAKGVGPRGSVVWVESDEVAAADATRNLADLPQTESRIDRVEHALAHGVLPDGTDIVVLDPPRTGAKREVVEGIVRQRPRVVSYVACEPASLARDIAIFAEHGYRLSGIRAFDIFPMTHHVECVAVLRPG